MERTEPNLWEVYEREKKQLDYMKLSREEYDAAIRAILDRLGL
jgi:molybdate-binding protein